MDFYFLFPPSLSLFSSRLFTDPFFIYFFDILTKEKEEDKKKVENVKWLTYFFLYLFFFLNSEKGRRKIRRKEKEEGQLLENVNVANVASLTSQFQKINKK